MQAAQDPVALRNKMAEQQLRARQLVLQQQADSAVAAASKTQREVYIGNLGGTQITAEALRDMFNSTMLAAFGDKVVPGLDPVVNVAMQPEGRFAFVEFRTPEMATASLDLSGKVQLLGVSLSIGRPAGYVDPVKALAAAQQSAIALAQFQDARLKEQNVACLEDGTATDGYATGILRIVGMVTVPDLEDETSFQELLAELKSECSTHSGGMCLRVYIPRPKDPMRVAELFGQDHYGQAYVQFIDAVAASKARTALHGRLFDSRALEVHFIHPTHYLQIQMCTEPGAMPPLQ